jgi:hypothetical protein
MGYDVKDRQLVINEIEAKSVRRVFELYLDEGNVPTLLERLVRERIRTPARTSTKGKQSGGLWFKRGHVYKLLSNPLYIGRVSHKGTSPAGQHEAIIDRRTWDAVQSGLAKNTQGERTRRRRSEPSSPLLAGLLYSEAGYPMIPMHSVKSGRRYEYYVEQRSCRSTPSNVPPDSMVQPLDASITGSNRQHVHRLPAREVDKAVVSGLTALLCDRRQWLEHLGQLAPAEIATATANAAQLAARLETDPTAVVVFLVRAIVGAGRLRLTIECGQLRSTLGLPSAEDGSTERLVRHVNVPLMFRKRGSQLKLAMNATGGDVAQQVDKTLVTAVARAFDWFDRLASGRARSIDDIAAADGFDAAFVSHIIPLAHIAPARVEGILTGTQPPELTADLLIRHADIPSRW